MYMGKRRNMDKTKVYLFDVTGGFNVRDELKPEVSHIGNLTKFRLPDGRAVSLIVALEIESADETKYEYVTSEREMAELGFEGLDYNKLQFHPPFTEP
jgi:hypothetical protein